MHNPLRGRARTFALLLALAAVVAVAAPAASANYTPPLRSSEEVSLEIYDAHLSQACDTEVFATLSGVYERKLVLGQAEGDAAYGVDTFAGQITWFSRTSGKSYSDGIRSKLQIQYPEGVELFAPARVTVTGRHGGTFPIGGGPAGYGVLVYDATVYAIDDQGFAYWFVNGDPISAGGNFDATAARICAALA
jgi:hypothetical protein